VLLATTKATRRGVGHQVKDGCTWQWVPIVSRDSRRNRNTGYPGDDDLAASCLDLAPGSPVNKVRHIVDHDISTRSGIKMFLQDAVDRTASPAIPDPEFCAIDTRHGRPRQRPRLCTS